MEQVQFPSQMCRLLSPFVAKPTEDDKRRHYLQWQTTKPDKRRQNTTLFRFCGAPQFNGLEMSNRLSIQPFLAGWPRNSKIVSQAKLMWTASVVKQLLNFSSNRVH